MCKQNYKISYFPCLDELHPPTNFKYCKIAPRRMYYFSPYIKLIRLGKIIVLIWCILKSMINYIFLSIYLGIIILY